jgi:endonuclease/exonuclease/phosphatase family metal-dependent hydrolase
VTLLNKTIKVMTFNLRKINEVDEVNIWHNRVERAARMILKHDMLVMGAQEAWPSMLKDLKPHLPDYTWLGDDEREDRRLGWRAPIFYKHKILEVVDQGIFWLSEEPEVYGSMGWDTVSPRVCVWVRFRFKEQTGQEFWHFNTHLDHKGIEARVRGISMIWQAIREKRKEADLPVVLTGDFNSRPTSDVIRFLHGEMELFGERAQLTDAFSILDAPAGRTAHGFRGGAEGNSIDYIFVSSEVRVQSVMVDREMIDGAYPSDHYPVKAEIRLP